MQYKKAKCIALLLGDNFYYKSLTRRYMPFIPRSKIKDLPPEPKRKRRGSRDLYEGIALMLWMFFLFSSLVLLIVSKGEMTFGGYQFSWDKFAEVVYIFFGFWILNSIAIYLFDKKAVLIENENFEYHMKNYKELRDNIMSLEKDKIELEKQKIAKKLTNNSDE